MSKSIVTHVFRNHRYWVYGTKHLEKDLLGETRYAIPGLTHASIAIPISGNSEIDLDTIIHESLHACTELNEEAVEESATAIANILWRLGWRKIDNLSLKASSDAPDRTDEKNVAE